jgi:hypothetical protein
MQARSPGHDAAGKTRCAVASASRSGEWNQEVTVQAVGGINTGAAVVK